jgi:hypothetical protein
MVAKETKKKEREMREAARVRAELKARTERSRARKANKKGPLYKEDRLEKVGRSMRQPIVNTGGKSERRMLQRIVGAKGGEKYAFEHMPPRVAKFMANLSNPFGTMDGYKSPVNFNPVPTLSTTTATVRSLNQISIPANSAVQFSLWPGHGPRSSGSSSAMDGESYHAKLIEISPSLTHMSVAPMPDGVAGNINGIGVYAPLGIGAVIDTFNITGIEPVVPAVTLPYVAATSDGQHTRWKLVGMGVKIINTSPEVERGGEIITVQPDIEFSGTATEDYSRFGSYAVHEPEKEVTIVWTPRIEDLSFWHTITESPVATGHAHSFGINIWMNAPALVAQSYVVEVVQHYELAGSSLRAISTPTLPDPAARNIIEPAISIVSNSGPTGSHLVHAAGAVAEGLAARGIAAAEGIIARAPKMLAGALTSFPMP